MNSVAAIPSTQFVSMRLPWDSSATDDGRFRKILRISLTVFLLLAILIPFLPLTEIVEMVVEETTPPLARVILEKKELPKPVPKVVKPKPKPKPKLVVKREPVKAVPKKVKKEQPKPVDKLAEAKKAAAVAGVLAFQDDLQAMRNTVDVSTLDQTRTSRGESSAAKTQRSIITGPARADSGGIQSAVLSSDTGGPALSGRETTTVASTIAANAGKKNTQGHSAQLGGRSDESIRRVMDANKGAIFAIYNRALRKDPLLEGKVVFEMIIDAQGRIEDITLLSTEMTDQTLTAKILSRIRLIQFGEEQVISTRVNYSFDFLPFT